MHPILFEIGPIKIFTYGFLLALGFLSAIFVAGREAKRLGIPPGKFFDLCFYIILAALWALACSTFCWSCAPSAPAP